MLKGRCLSICLICLFGMLAVLSGCSDNASDLSAPSRPTGLQLNTISSSQIDLEWNASTDNVGVKGYYIYRDGVKVGQSTETSFSDTGLTEATEYSYTVASYDAAGYVSSQSISEEEETYPESFTIPTITPSISAPEFSSIVFTDGSTSSSQFPVNNIKDLYILVYWQGGSGNHQERIEVYTPEGTLYQQVEESFTASSNTEVQVRLPIAGTYITQHAIFGVWTVKVYRDNESEQIATASVTLQ